MIQFANPLFAKADGPPPVIGPIDPVTLFAGGIAGGYWDFTTASTLAVNADGSGGVPAVGAEFRSASDLGPNGHRLRNTVDSVTRLANGMLVHASYGLFNLPSSYGAALGDWSTISAPFEIVACMAQQSYDALYSRLLCDYGGPVGLLQGSAAGKVVAFGGAVGSDIDLPMATEAVVRMQIANGTMRLTINNGAMIDTGVSAIDWGGFLIGPAGDSTPAQVRFKRVLFLGRALSGTEASGVHAWMSA